MSIKTRLLLAIVGIMVFVGLFAGYIIYWQDNQKLTENSNAEIKNTINYTFQLVDSTFNRAQDNIVNLANNQVIIQAIETKDPQKLARASDIIQNAAETVSIVKNIALEEVSGSTCIVRSGDESVLSIAGTDLSFREYCDITIKTQAPYIASALISASAQQLTIPIIAPVKNSKGEVIGLIASALDLNELRGYLLDLQQDSSVVLLDRSGVPFLDTTQEINKLDAPLTAVENEVKKGLADNKKEGYFQYQNNFVGYKSSDGITVIYEESNAKLLSFAKALNLTIFLALATALILMVAFIYFFVGIITKRISRLSMITQRIAGGEFNIKLEEKDFKAKDEIAVLARAFNNMAAKLKESYSGLEEKVRVRTQDLENSKIATQNVLEDLQIEKETLDNAKAKDGAFSQYRRWSSCCQFR
ncbi:MAG: HAMP domain-containing protein [Candidatus Moranbacteria bacterium]|nr:HAMP domain-containing protein [Candidatus Moranbacteria bacterium]